MGSSLTTCDENKSTYLAMMGVHGPVSFFSLFKIHHVGVNREG